MPEVAVTPVKFEKPVADYLRIATIAPEVSVADVSANVAALTQAHTAAKGRQAELLVCPELSLTGYTAADLFHNEFVLEQTAEGLTTLAGATKDGPALLVGAPLRHNGVLYNCAVMLAEGRIQGGVPKTYLPTAKEFYDRRWFTSGEGVENESTVIDGQSVPFGTDIMWQINGTKVAAEVCEDMFAPISPGTHAVLAGAEVVANLSASNELIGKPDYRRDLIRAFTGKTACAYVYVSAGPGESVADVVYGGHQIIAENGRIAAEQPPLSDAVEPLVYDIDRTYLEHDRLVEKTWADQATQQDAYRTIEITVPSPQDNQLLRFVDAAPFVPANPETLERRCEELFAYMSYPLAQRIKEKNTRAIVLGLSGGLDSTLALLTALEAAKRLGKPAGFIHTITMPGPASSERTQENATLLAEALDTTHSVKPIKELSAGLLRLIGHDGKTEDITYENTQARLRTDILMNYANRVGGLVQGSGDMSENAIGWCTYNGDHMSMLNPNGGIPKTLVKHLVRWYADSRADEPVREILHDILETPISPELTGSDLSQTTEDVVGPYTLTDFFLYELNRRGSRAAKIGYLATRAFEGTYDEPTIAKWLGAFLERYTHSQWKRDVMPNTTKVGTISLSPRGDLRMAPNTGAGWYK